MPSHNVPDSSPQTTEGNFPPATKQLADKAVSPTPANFGTLILDQQTGQLLAADQLAQTKFSLPDSDLSQLDPRDLFPQLATPLWTKAINPLDKNTREFSTLLPQAEGNKLAITVRITPLTGTDLNLLLLAIQPSPSPQDKLIHRDALTGLPDRRELFAQYQRWQQMAGDQKFSFAVLFLDLDQFKQINDQLGHAAGDQVLKTLAERWQNCLRDGDLVVRYGGDEIVILLKGITERKEVEPVLKRLAEVTQQPLVAGENTLQVGATIGVAVSSPTSENLEELIVAADQDMYAAKRLKSREP